jgi:hypothetical protein
MMGVAVVVIATIVRSDAAGSATDAAVLGSRRCRAIRYMSSCAGRARHVVISSNERVNQVRHQA